MSWTKWETFFHFVGLLCAKKKNCENFRFSNVKV